MGFFSSSDRSSGSSKRKNSLSSSLCNSLRKNSIRKSGEQKKTHESSSDLVLPGSRFGDWEKKRPALQNEMLLYACLFAWKFDEWPAYKSKMENLLMNNKDERIVKENEEMFFTKTSSRAYLKLLEAREYTMKEYERLKHTFLKPFCPFQDPYADIGYVESRLRDQLGHVI